MSLGSPPPVNPRAAVPLGQPISSAPPLMPTLARFSRPPALSMTHHLWAAPIYPALILLWTFLIVYGSLLPLDQKLPEHVQGWGDLVGWLPSLLSAPSWDSYLAPWRVLSTQSSELRGDLWLNLLLYFPLGLLVRLHDGSRNRKGWIWWVRGMAAIGVLGWLLECVQGLSPMRWSNLTDVLYNQIGALLGMAVAVVLLRAIKRSLFWCYCRLAYPIHRLRVWLGRERHLPGVMLGIGAVNGVLLTWWWQAGGSGSNPPEGMNLLPFWHEFHYDYSRAVQQIVRTLLVYGVVALLLSLQFLSVHRRRGLGLVLGCVFLSAMFLQGGRMNQRGSGFDVTEPLLALSACALMTLGLRALVRSVKAHCRRRKPVPVPVDRRRMRHIYAPSRQGPGPCSRADAIRRVNTPADGSSTADGF